MPTIIRKKEIKADTQYSENVFQEYGIDSAVVKNIDPPFTLFLALIPPGHKNRAHYHIHSTQGQYYLKGRLRHFFGPRYNEQSVDIEAGDYLYLPRGIIHHGMNLSDTEPVEILCAYAGVRSRFDSDKSDAELFQSPFPQTRGNRTGEKRAMAATHIKGKGAKHTTSDDPPLDLESGIDSTTIDNIDPPFVLSHAILPAGTKTRARYYTNCSCGIYMAKGKLRYIYFGPKCDEHGEDIEAGDYLYSPRGEIHYLFNPSKVDSTDLVMVYAGVTGRKGSGKIYVEPPRD